MSLTVSSRAVWQEPPRLSVDELAITDHPLLSAVLHARGVTTRAAAEAFLAPRRTMLSDPYLLPDLDRAAGMIRSAIAAGEPIGIFGDYDVDGLTATALLVRALRALGSEVMALIPHRIDDGYGLSSRAIDQFMAAGVKLVVTVDCGSSNCPELEYALSRGLRAVVLDHHQLSGDLPPSVPFVSPQRPDNRFPNTTLAAVGVAYQLVRALLGDERAEMYLPYVALGTIADVMDLRGENRTLVTRGIGKLRRWKLPGIMALCASAGIDQAAVRSWDVAYLLAPRLNAAGRVDSPDVALDLLLADTAAVATPLAIRLNEFNERRQAETQRVIREAEAQIAAMGGPDEWPALVVADPSWSLGIAGLVAGRLAERYARPVVVLQQGEALSRGSARSGGVVDLVAALQETQPILQRFGGHQRAAGLALATEQITRFRHLLSEAVLRACDGEMPRVNLLLDAEIEHRDLTFDTLDLFDVLEPYGEGNPRPTFLICGLTTRYVKTSGDGRHLLFQVLDRRGRSHAVVYFSAGDRLAELRSLAGIDLAATLVRDSWQGRVRLKLHARDFRAAS